MSKPAFVEAEFTEGWAEDAPPSVENAMLRRVDPSTPGRPGHALPQYLRDLTQKDIEGQEDETSINPTARLRLIKDVHHRCAQLMAQGEKDVTVARVTGLSPATVRNYRNDVAFKELLAHYRQELSDKFDAAAEQMSLLVTEAVGEMRHRLQTDPDSINASELTKVITEMADRTGRGAVTKNVNVNIDGTQRMQEARARIEAERRGRVEVKT